MRNPDAPPVPAPAPWPARGAARRKRTRLQALVLGLPGAAALALLAAWAVPPSLDWGRFRMGIAAIAAAQLGRPVAISGEVSLRLLPEAVLTATNVVLPDQGDGVSAELSTLRLEVSVLPLLAGRIRPLDLVLGAPVVHLPWPLPDSVARRARGPASHAFAVHIENGTFRLGQAEVTGINAALHDGQERRAVSGPAQETGAQETGAQETGAGFGAEGFAAFSGRSWRFTGALGLPDADGVSALDVVVSGQGLAARTDASLQGTLADGVVQGRLRASGPDLSVLLPTGRFAWQTDIPFVASATSVEARSITMSLGASTADASLALRIAPPIRLDGRVHAESLDLDGWARMIGVAGGSAHRFTPRLAGRVELQADTAGLQGGAMTGLHGTLVSDGNALSLEHAGGVLPGRARVEASLALTGSDGLLRISGPGRLDAPDLRTTLRWAHGLAPALIDALPAGVLGRASLTGMIDATPGAASVSELAGQLDGAGISGRADIGFGPRRHLGATLTLDRLALDDWTLPGWPIAAAFAQAGRFWSGLDADLHLRAAEGTLHGAVLSGLVLDARSGEFGLKVDRAAASMSGVQLTASGGLGGDGALSGCLFRAVAQEAASVSNSLPAGWRWTAGLWRGPASLEAALSGPPGAAETEVRADIGDLVVEAELRADLLGRKAAGSITLRHPGAPRLLALLGVAGAERWLDTGSVSLRGNIKLQPGDVSVSEFDLAAADLRLSGTLDLGYAGAEPFLRGAIDAERLAVPGWADWPPLDPAWLRGWAAQVHVTAREIVAGGRPAAGAATAEFGVGGGLGLLDVAGLSWSGGRLAGQVAVDASQTRPVVAIHGQATGLHVAGPVTGWPVDLVSGEVDGTLDAEAAGSLPMLEQSGGTAMLALHDVQFDGFDLAAALRPQSRPALLAALSHGATGGLDGAIRVDMDRGTLRLAPTTLVSAAGAVGLEGAADASRVRLRFGLRPSGASITETGPWSAVAATPDPGIAPVAPHRRKRRSGAAG